MERRCAPGFRSLAVCLIAAGPAPAGAGDVIVRTLGLSVLLALTFATEASALQRDVPDSTALTVAFTPFRGIADVTGYRRPQADSVVVILTRSGPLAGWRISEIVRVSVS